MKLRNGLSGIVIAGMALASSTSQSQVTEAWFRSFDYQGGLDVAVDVATDVYGSVYVTGYGTHPEEGLNVVTVKYDRAGQLKWFKPYDGPANGDDVPVRIYADRAKRRVRAVLGQGEKVLHPGVGSDRIAGERGVRI